MPKRHILWVDDNPDNNIAERDAMTAYNIDFTLARSTGEALAKLKDTRFGAIISDMGRSPDRKAGYTLLEALRDSGDNTPYFIYAGRWAATHEREALARGAQGCTNIATKLIADIFKQLGISGRPD